MSSRLLYRDVSSGFRVTSIAGVCFILADSVNAAVHLVSLSIGGIAGVASFGAAVVGLSQWNRSRLGRYPVATLDEHGLTVTQSLFGVIDGRTKTLTVPWDNVSGASIGSLLRRKRDSDLFNGVIVGVRDAEHFLSPLSPRLRTYYQDRMHRIGGPIYIPRTRDESQTDVVALIESYRDADTLGLRSG
jgi:hypothetical protein